MDCIKCGGETRVVNSRPSGKTVIRRRACSVCKERFSTKEMTVDQVNYANRALRLMSEWDRNFKEYERTIKELKDDFAKMPQPG